MNKFNYLEKNGFVSVDDTGFLYGYGLFETFLVNNEGKVFLLENHIKRLMNSIEFFKIDFDIGEAGLVDMVNKYIENNNLANVILRMTVSAGNKQKGVLPSLSFACRNNTYTVEVIEGGCRLMVSDLVKSESSLIIRHKTSNYLENFLRLREALSKGFDDAVFMNTGMKVTETVKSNIFFAKKDILYTPEINCGLLPGITRQWVIERTELMGIKCIEGVFCIEEVLDADEVFVCNSAMGIMHVRDIDGKVINSGNAGELTNIIKHEYLDLK